MKENVKVLILAANPINRVNGNGIMMRSLFSDWGRERLCQAYFPSVTDLPCDFDVCTRYLRVDLLGRATQPVSQPAHLNLKRSSRLRFAKGLHRWGELVREGMWSVNGALARTHAFVEAERPQLIYSLLGSLSLCRFTMALSERHSLPVVVHLTDNWIDTLYRGCAGETLLRSQLIRYTKRLMTRATATLAISPLMAQEMERRFARPFYPFTTCVEDRAIAETIINGPDAPDGLALLYAGGLSIGRAAQLEKIAEAIERLPGTSWQLNLCASEAEIATEAARFARFKRTRILGWLDRDALDREVRAADVVVHVESFDPEIAKYTRLSLSTKISQYMATGKCILAFAPSRLASTEYVRETGAGIVIDQDELSAIVVGCEMLLASPEFRRAAAKKGLACAREAHAASAVRGKFKSILNQSVSK